jgi:hypothetical protein
VRTVTPLADSMTSQPAFSADGKTIAFVPDVPGVIYGGGGTALMTVSAAGGTPTTLTTGDAMADLISKPAYSPDGKSIAFYRFPSTVTAQQHTVRLVIRDLTTGAERVAAEYDFSGPAGNPRISTYPAPSWSPDSSRIAYVETEPASGTGSPTSALVTVKPDGSDKRVILQVPAVYDMGNTDGIYGIAWSKPKLPSYYIKHVEVSQAISPELGTLGANDPLQSPPYTIEWSEPSAYGIPVPLIAGKPTLLRIYVGDASLAAGETVGRSITYRVTDQLTGQTYGDHGPQTVGVTAPDVAPQQAAGESAINVWLPAGAATAGEPHSFKVEVNLDQSQPECGGCYPNGNVAIEQGVRYDEGGNIVIAPVPIIETTAGQSEISPPDGMLRKAVSEAIDELPIGNSAITIAPSPGKLTIARSDLILNKVLAPLWPTYSCDVLMTRLLELRAMPGIAGPVAGFGATRWVGYAPDSPDQCGGKADDIPGHNIVLESGDPQTFAHELGHTLGLTHVTGREKAAAGAISYPYSPSIGGVGYAPEADTVVTGGESITRIFDPASTADLMSYDEHTWTSPQTWLTMYERILAESSGPTTHATDMRAATTARGGAPTLRRLVSGIIGRNRAMILDSIVTEATTPASAGPQAARLLALDPNGHTVAQATVRGTPYAEGVEPTPSLPFVVALPAGANVTSLEVLPPHGRRPLARVRASRHAPSGRFLHLPRKAAAARPLSVRWSSSDRDRNDRLLVVLLARRGTGPWHTILIGPAKGTATITPSAIGRGKKLTLQLRISDGLRTTQITGATTLH